jgi:hypothetical protein
MFWSISESRTFKKCQRQWYYKNFLASPTAKDPVRHTTYLLGKLQSISAWRGNLVDAVISETVLPAVRARRTVNLSEARQTAREKFDRQLAFARRHALHEPGLKPAQLEGEFAAFYCMEYGGIIPEDEVARAWDEVESALGNFFGMRELASELKSAKYLICQRALMFPHSGMTVRAVPDAVIFYDDAPPLIVDWKVHAFGLQEAWTQLAIYAIALMRCKPHSDFPASLSRWGVTDVRLAEAQLLTNQVRRYSLSEEDAERADAYIAQSVTLMLLATEGRKGVELEATDFPVAASPEICQRCPYRKLCWEETS